jgi:hypothetical protein
MRKWHLILKEIDEIIARQVKKDEIATPLFRGHGDAAWKLQPGLARIGNIYKNENYMYNQFQSKGSHLIPKNSKWDILFSMQQYGLPTRLLDWTENFTIALFFAIKNMLPDRDAAVWILDPYEINEKWYKQQAICNLDDDFKYGYFDYFAHSKNDERQKFPADFCAIFSSPYHTRMRCQQSYFTLHNNLNIPLEEAHAHALHKIIIPYQYKADAERYLILCGVNEFTVFPDLNGLAICTKEHLKKFKNLYNDVKEPKLSVLIRDFSSDKKIALSIMTELVSLGIPKEYFQQGIYDESKEKNETICIGNKFPAKSAKKILDVALKNAPFIKYIRHFNEDPSGILIGGKTEFALNRGVRPFNENDIKQLLKNETTNTKFHKLIAGYIT